MDSSAPSRVESGLSGSRAAASSYGRCLGDDARDTPARRFYPRPPVWHDGSERPIQRPTDPEAQQAYDSGQKQWHRLKTLRVINELCHSCFLSHPYEGKASDTNLAAPSGSSLPPGSCLDQDTGFQGFFLPGITIVQPQQKPPGGELTPPDQAINRRLASIRIRLEPVIGGVKRDRIVKDKIRLLKDGIRDAVMETCCGWQNFRLQYRPWHYAS
jgi:hypothetical protein